MAAINITICNLIILVAIILSIWTGVVYFNEGFVEDINAEKKLGKGLIRGSAIYFNKTGKLDKGYLSKEKF